jgi:hypothetical protein
MNPGEPRKGLRGTLSIGCQLLRQSIRLSSASRRLVGRARPLREVEADEPIVDVSMTDQDVRWPKQHVVHRLIAS